MRSACPSCPDGYVWTREGPTGKACPTCKGKAYLGDDDEDDSASAATPWANISRTMSDWEAFDMSDRPCTCHPDDNPPVPCPRKYALSKCRAADEAAVSREESTMHSDRETVAL